MRVTSEQIRQFIYAVGEGIVDYDQLEHIELYKADGTPFDFASDPTRMRWRGEFDPMEEYAKNDVVTDVDSLYICVVDVAGDDLPDEDVSWEIISVSGSGGGLNWLGSWLAATAYAVDDAVMYAGSSYRRKIAGTTATAPAADQINWELIAGVLPTAMDQVHIVGAPGEPAFQNSFANLGGGEPTARFRKDPSGTVSISGAINGPAAGIAFTLPVGYRPTGSVWYTIVGAGGTTQIQITVAGAVSVQFGGVTRLNGIDFDTETVTQVSTPGAQPLDPVHLVGTAGEPAFQNGASNYATGEPPVSFRKDPAGEVMLNGSTNAPAAGVMFTLPVGYRPVGKMWYSNVAAAGASFIIIDANGNVSTTAAGVNRLSGISFDTQTVTNYVFNAIGPQLVSVLPANPFDGQEIYFQNVEMGDKGVIWPLRYRASAVGPYKWEAVSASPWAIATPGPQNLSPAALATMYNLPTMPTIAVPLAGDYMVQFAVPSAYKTGAAAGMCGAHFFVWDGVAQVTLDCLIQDITQYASAGCELDSPVTGLAAGKLLRIGYKQENMIGANVMQIVGASFSIRPIRVG